jgi:hypothetical protein
MTSNDAIEPERRGGLTAARQARAKTTGQSTHWRVPVHAEGLRFGEAG